MRPLTDTRLKGSMPIHNTPLLIHIANQLQVTGLMDKLVLVISPWQEKAMHELFSTTPYADKVHFTIQDPPKGTGDAVAKAEAFIEEDKECLVLNGDIITDLVDAIPKIIDQHRKLKAKCTMLVFPGKDTRYGQLQVTPDGRVLDIKEKIRQEELRDEIGYINAGVYLFDHEIFDSIRKTPLSKRGEYEITDAISILSKSGPIGALITHSWMSLENPFDLFTAQLYFKVKDDLQCMQFHSGAEMGFKAAEDVYFDSETDTKFSSIIIKGPVLIGKGTLIETGSIIGPNVYIGPDCEIGSNVKMTNSLLMNNCRVNSNCEIRNLISAEELLIGEKTKILPQTSDPLNLDHFVILGGKTIIANEVDLVQGVKIKAHSVIKADSKVTSDY